VIRDYSPKRDTLTLWFDVPPEELPDTIRGSISYLKHDSINQLQPVAEKLALFWKSFEKREKKEEEEKPVNPFKLTVEGGATINPEKNIPIIFEYPLRRVDSTAISLLRMADGKRFRVHFGFERDTANLRRWTLGAPWAADQRYQLEIAAGAFENIRGERNDTLRSEFTVAAADKYGAVTIDLKGKTPESEYILQITGQSGNLLQERRHARDGRHIFRYLDPGNIRIRIVEDINRNGKWDDGDLILHRQPERVEFFWPDPSKEEIPIKANWEVDYTIDMNKLFAPTTIESVRAQIAAREQQRIANLLKQRDKNRQKAAGGGMSGGSGGGFGGGGMGSGGGMPAIPGLRR
jgi:hypothetical protein